MIYVNGWYEIAHNPHDHTSGLTHAWRPREIWCGETFAAETWQLRQVVYEFLAHATDNTQNQMWAAKPLTWMFKHKEDALLFLLRWPL